MNGTPIHGYPPNANVKQYSVSVVVVADALWLGRYCND
jgi:hypothetical protein